MRALRNDALAAACGLPVAVTVFPHNAELSKLGSETKIPEPLSAGSRKGVASVEGGLEKGEVVVSGGAGALYEGAGVAARNAEHG